jgi:bifunctional DNA-binding transcriptional regulator/antitoxin component of YhaV-PrlF toxin-antitoxin module
LPPGVHFVNAKGTLVLPAEVRKALGVPEEGGLVQLVVDEKGGHVKLFRVRIVATGT